MPPRDKDNTFRTPKTQCLKQLITSFSFIWLEIFEKIFEILHVLSDRSWFKTIKTLLKERKQSLLYLYILAENWMTQWIDYESIHRWLSPFWKRFHSKYGVCCCPMSSSIQFSFLSTVDIVFKLSVCHFKCNPCGLLLSQLFVFLMFWWRASNSRCFF